MTGSCRVQIIEHTEQFYDVYQIACIAYKNGNEFGKMSIDRKNVIYLVDL